MSPLPAPPAGQPHPPPWRAALYAEVVTERYGPPVRGKPFRLDFQTDTRINQAVRRYLLMSEEDDT